MTEAVCMYGRSCFNRSSCQIVERGGQTGKMMPLETHKNGFIVTAKVAVKQVYSKLKGGQCNKLVICSSRLPSLSRDTVNFAIESASESLKKRRIRVTLQDGCASNPEESDIWSSFKSGAIKNLLAFYRFSRPHTVIGTLIGITSVSLLPIESIVELSFSFFLGLLKALIPSVLMNIYVVGLNQLFDVEIDKINKPDLPLASGDFAMGTGVTIVSASVTMSLAMGIIFRSPPLIAALLISFVLGSIYSIELPLLRWKKQAILAASCILIVRAVVVQLAFFVHFQKFVLGKPVVITRSLVFATAFMCFFSAVIALFKDIPDVDGDRDFGIKSFTVSLGQERVFWLCINMLLFAYGAAVVVGASSSFLASKLVMIMGHCTLAAVLWLRARSVHLGNKVSISSFYMFIWKLFYAEYFLIPFVR